ncbi:tiny macrocysts protein C, partial [Haematococcus lacustris]
VILMSQQTAGVTDLNSVGIAARTVGKVTHSMHELDVLLSGRGQPNLPGLTGMEDYQGRNNFMNDLLTRAWDLHQGVYMGFDKRRRLPDKDQPTQVETVYEDTSPVMTVYTRNVSLWDAGNNYVSKGADIWQNARAHYAATNNFASWSNVQYIVDNGPNLMIPAYYQTMNAFLQTVIRQPLQSTHSAAGPAGHWMGVPPGLTQALGAAAVQACGCVA